MAVERCFVGMPGRMTVKFCKSSAVLCELSNFSMLKFIKNLSEYSTGVISENNKLKTRFWWLETSSFSISCDPSLEKDFLDKNKGISEKILSSSCSDELPLLESEGSSK